MRDTNRSKTGIITAVVLIAVVFLSGCDPKPQAFALPPGDAEAGRATFVSIGCNYCHRIQGKVELAEGESEWTHTLGGPVTKVKSYADLVTSIINPSHKLAPRYKAKATTDKSPMPTYNDIMTVEELIDVVTFLEGTYSVVRPAYQPYVYGP